MSADEGYVEHLAALSLTRDGGALYAQGRVVLFAPKGSPIDVAAGLDGLRHALADRRISRFAIANPEHAPYGRAAEQVLRSQGLWELIRPRLVLGENASQATQFASTGNADGGIVPYSLAVAPPIAALGSFALLSEDWHAPLRQRMVLLQGANATATAFYAFLQRPAARAVFKKYGFLLPGETS
jgi:molybdate transport system substrate-binding protein